MKTVAIIDYGMGNLRSVAKAIEKIGAIAKVTAKKKEIEQAYNIILPGVGAFYQAMSNLNRLGLTKILLSEIDKGKPFLGICLGLQLLFSESSEGGQCKGLRIIAGKVKKFRFGNQQSTIGNLKSNNSLKIPHMGWDSVKQITNDKLQMTIFKGIRNNAYFYFAHSYYVNPIDKNAVAGTTDYGVRFVSAVAKNNVFGVQFHPEKSGEVGIQLLKNFINL